MCGWGGGKGLLGNISPSICIRNVNTFDPAPIRKTGKGVGWGGRFAGKLCVIGAGSQCSMSYGCYAQGQVSDFWQCLCDSVCVTLSVWLYHLSIMIYLIWHGLSLWANLCSKSFEILTPEWGRGIYNGIHSILYLWLIKRPMVTS